MLMSLHCDQLLTRKHFSGLHSRCSCYRIKTDNYNHFGSSKQISWLGQPGCVECLKDLPAGNCWMGTDGTATPSDQSATSGWVNSAAGALHSPWNSSFPTAFSAAACSSFSIYIKKRGGNANLIKPCSIHLKLVDISSNESHLLRIPVEVQIRHDLPWVLSGNGSPHAENFPRQHPPHETHRVVTLQMSQNQWVKIDAWLPRPQMGC